MATKKQKREAGEAKAKREAEERRQSGLAAQKADRQLREKRSVSRKIVSRIDPDEQPLLGGIDDYLGSLDDMTVGEFRDRIDKFHEGWLASLRLDVAKNPFETVVRQFDIRGSSFTVKEAEMKFIEEKIVGRRPELTSQFLTAEEANKILNPEE